MTAAGSLQKLGAGTVVLAGNGTYSGNAIFVNDGNVRVQDGAQILAGTGSTAVLNVASGANANANAGAVVSGSGSKLSGAGTAVIGAGDNSIGVVTVENGGLIQVASATTLAGGTGSTATLNVVGGSTYQGTSFAFSRGQGFVNVTSGSVIRTTGVGIGGNIAVGTPTGGTGTVVVSGAGSRWEASASYFLTAGSLAVLDGGLVTTPYMRIGVGANATATALVSGAGSEIRTAGNGNNSFDLGTAGNGTLTVANGGKVTVQTQNGSVPTIKVGTGSTGSGVLNIGGGTGQAATNAGTINAGLIQLGARGAINFNHTDANYMFGVPITGTGAVNQIGSGTTVLTGVNTYDGATIVSSGTLMAGGLATLSSASAYTTENSGTLDLDGFDHRVAALANGGNVRLSRTAGTEFIVTGDYAGNGGTLYISSVLGSDDSVTDLLHVEGSTSGTTNVIVANVGGAGAETTGDGIRIVQVDGASGAGAFVLGGPAIGGAYTYNLFQYGIADPADGDWYLRAAGLAPTIPVYEAYRRYCSAWSRCRRSSSVSATATGPHPRAPGTPEKPPSGHELKARMAASSPMAPPPMPATTRTPRWCSRASTACFPKTAAACFLAASRRSTAMRMPTSIPV